MTDWGAGSRSFRGRLSRVRNEARLSNPVSRTVTNFLGFDADSCGFVRGPISERAICASCVSRAVWCGLRSTTQNPPEATP